jgi:predicted transcriptional regulator
MHPELNVTEISNLVKQSKSTVSRHLNEMEHDGFVISREKETPITGRIPPKCYRINPDAFRGQCTSRMMPPEDPAKRLEYIKAEIHMYQYYTYEIQKMLDYMNKVMSNLSSECTTIEKADEIFKTYLSGKLEPFVGFSFHNEKEFKDLMELINECTTRM